jgi:hypothetical protein
MIAQDFFSKVIHESNWLVLDYNFIVKYLFIFYLQQNSCMCIHIESTTLTDGTYELVPEFENEQHEAQVNLNEIVKDPNQRLEEPKASFA